VSGIDWPALAPGSELVIGRVRLSITRYTSPCEKIASSFAGDDYTRISQKRHPAGAASRRASYAAAWSQSAMRSRLRLIHSSISHSH
jgi:hypothetical protein